MDHTIQISTTEKSAQELVPKRDIDDIFEIYQDRKVTDFKEYKNLDGLLEKLNVIKATGLDHHNLDDLQKRRSMYSVIVDQEEKSKSIFEYIFDALEDVMLRLLIVVACVSICLGIIQDGWAKGWFEGTSIIVSVIIVVSIQSYSDYSKEKQFAVLHKIQAVQEHETKRNGHIHMLNVKDWVVGDIIQITPGCVPKADGILISCDIPVQTDESSLTGENEPQHKEIGCCIFEGCPIVDGYGEMVILRLGSDSCQGRIKALMSEEDEEETTPLQDKLEIMANQIGVLALYAASITFITLISFQIYNNYNKDLCFFCLEFFQDLSRHLMAAFGIIIMAIPEGLPLSVTIALAYSVHQMYLEKNLVKKLKSCETMGGVSDICTDKTGTLTYGNMILKKILLNSNSYNVESLVNNKSQTKELLLKIIQNTSKAIVDVADDGVAIQKGNITEIGLIKWVLEQEQPRSYYNQQKIKEFPFTSKNRCSGTIVNINGTQYLYVKGQPDTIIPSCSNIYHNDDVIEFDEAKKQKILKNIEEHNCLAFRGLTFAIKQIEGDFSSDFNTVQLNDLISSNDLTFVATCYLQDIVREEVPKAVESLRRAGVTTRMITGDAYQTAKAIGIQTGIIYPHEESAITTGYQIAQMSDLELSSCVDKFKIVAKCSPEQKLKFVKALKSQDKIVAVTGDGTNDALCFQVSDVAFTMGQKGTEIIKEAGDIILIDDNYASIVTACSWGRNIQEGIRKFLVFQLTVNIVGVFICLLGSVIIQESPLSSSQMLWINLIMDTFASLALATDHPTEELLRRQPYRRNEDLINGYMKRNIVFQCIYQIVALSFVLLYGDNIFGVPEMQYLDVHEFNHNGAIHMTIFFHTFVLLQLFNEFNCRDLRRDILNPFKDLFRNKYFLGVIIFSFIVQYSLVFFGGQTFRCTRINLVQHLFCIIIGMGGLLVGLIVNLIPESFYESIAMFRDYNQLQIYESQRKQSGEHLLNIDSACQANESYQHEEGEYGSMSMEHQENIKKELFGEKNL
ncbi:hypothetical protein ABPG74_012524 [Tetrahymena malaccensis]